MPDAQPRRPRNLGSATTTTATQTALTVVFTVTATPLPQPENASSGGAPITAILLIVLAALACLVGCGTGAYWCSHRKSRNAAREREFSSALPPPSAGHELQHNPPPPRTDREVAQAEAYGYYAPAAKVSGISIGIGGGRTEEERAAIRNVVYSHFAPTRARPEPRTRDEGVQIAAEPRTEAET